MRFSGKTIIVTGAGYGIGERIAKAFAAEGGQVILAARSLDAIDSVAKSITDAGGAAAFIQTDVTDETQVQAMVDFAMDKFGRLDVLVNNAGIAGPTKTAEEVTAEEWAQTLDVNLTGPFLCCKYAIPFLSAEGGGAIVNIGSVAGRIGYPLRAPYAASKWGLIGLNHTLACELGPQNVRVNCVCPGPVAGDRIDAVIAARAEAAGVSLERAHEMATKNVPMRRMVTADEIADTVLYFASDAASGTTGQAITVDGGLRMQ